LSNAKRQARLRRWRGLVILLLVALALRLINLHERPLWYDEAFAVLFAGQGLEAMLYGTLTPVAGGAADIHPLLYYTTLNGWMALVGQSAFAVRLWSVFLGVLTVAAVFTLARRLINVQVAWAAALMTALAPFHIQYSQETRMYALLGLLAALTAYVFVRATSYRLPVAGYWLPATSQQLPATNKSVVHSSQFTVHSEKRSAISSQSSASSSSPHHPVTSSSLISSLVTRHSSLLHWIAFGILAALMMYTQQLAAFYLAALGLLPIIRRQWRVLPGLALGVGVAVLVYLPWLVQLPGQLAKVGSYYWIEQPGIAAFLRTTFSFLVVNLDLPRETFAWTLAVAVFVVVLLGAFLLLRLTSRRSRKLATLPGGLTALWLAVVPVVGMWLVSQVRPVYLERALLPSALMLYLFIGWMLAGDVIPRLMARLLVVPLAALAITGATSHYGWATFPNSPFNTAVAALRARWQPGDVIVHQNKLSALPMRFYGRDLAQAYIADRPGSPEDTLALPTQEALDWLANACVQQAGASAGRIWWVEFDRVAAQAAAAGRVEYTQAVEWLNAHFTSLEVIEFNDLTVTLYADPHGERADECPSIPNS
jgi:4-amino-4-deoxy-L-arabinose transferase-like glycosyltransferase